MDKEIAVALIGLAVGIVSLVTLIVRLHWWRLKKKEREKKGGGDAVEKLPSSSRPILITGKCVRLIGEWNGKAKGGHYSFDGIQHLKTNGVESRITWILKDAGSNSWLKKNKKKGDSCVESVTGCYGETSLYLKGHRVSDPDLVIPSNYEIHFREDGRFSGKSNDESGEGSLEGVYQVFLDTETVKDQLPSASNLKDKRLHV